MRIVFLLGLLLVKFLVHPRRTVVRLDLVQLVVELLLLVVVLVLVVRLDFHYFFVVCVYLLWMEG